MTGPCAAGDCIKVSASKLLPAVLYITTETGGHRQLKVTRAEFAAFAAAIRNGEYADLEEMS